MKILVIEDEKGIADFIRQGLEEEGYTITVADNGTEGLALTLSDDYDLLLVDWMLPGMTGIELCRKIRIEKQSLPIIFLTAKDTLQDTITGLEAGANDYIKKPFHFEELLVRVKVQLRQNTAQTAPLTLGEIKLDTQAHRVWKGEEEISLTQREFELLAYLLRNKGKVCRRTEIIEEVWDIHFDYNTGVIDVYINAIRKKLNLQKEGDYINTVRGVGYIAKE